MTYLFRGQGEYWRPGFLRFGNKRIEVGNARQAMVFHILPVVAISRKHHAQLGQLRQQAFVHRFVYLVYPRLKSSGWSAFSLAVVLHHSSQELGRNIRERIHCILENLQRPCPH